MQDVPGLWIIASLFGAVGAAMSTRWALTRTESEQARKRGMMRGAIIEVTGFALVCASAVGRPLLFGVVIIFGIGTAIGAIASRALRPPM